MGCCRLPALLGAGVVLLLVAPVHASADTCAAGAKGCQSRAGSLLTAEAMLARMPEEAGVVFEDIFSKDLDGGEIFHQKVLEVLAAFRTGGKPNLSVWFLELMLARRGLSVRKVLMKQNVVVGTLTAAQVAILKTMLYEFSVAAYYTSYRPLGMLACEVLLFDRRVSQEVKNNVANSVVWYASPIPHERTFEITTEMPFIDEATGLRFKASNPAILRTETGYIIMLRANNYKHDHGRNFESLAADKVYRSRYFRLVVDKQLTVLTKNEMTIRHVKRPVIRTHFNNEGVEDTRVLLIDGQLWFTASAYDQSHHNTIRIVLCQLSAEPDSNGEVRVVSWTPLDGPDPHRNEKNWLPFMHNGTIHAFYSLGPETIVARIHPDTGKWDPVFHHVPDFDFSRFRGSAGPLPFEVNGVAGLLCVVHEVTFYGQGHRYYVHRLVWLDAGWVVRRVSLTFVLDHLGVEYCSGMAYAHDADEIFLTAGIEEGSARMFGIATATLRSMLQPIPSLGV